MVAHRPIIVVPLDRVGQRLPLRVALNAGVAGRNVVHVRGVQDTAARWMGDMLADRTVAALTAHVPLSDLLGVDIVVYGMAPVAGGSGGALHVVRRIKPCPPVSSCGYDISAPCVVFDFPLRSEERRVGKE